MVDPKALGELLGLLHANGYRLRRLAPDTIELSDTPQPGAPQRPDDLEALAKAEADDAEEVKWAHVGGKPAFLRDARTAPVDSPWSDTEKAPS